MKKLLLALGMVTAFSANADVFQIDAGTNNTGSLILAGPLTPVQVSGCGTLGGVVSGGDCFGVGTPQTQTLGLFTQIGANISNATSVYFDTTDDDADTVADTNVGIGDLFVDSGSLTTGITFPNPNDPALGAYQVGGFNATWNMTVDYLLYGEVVDAGTDLAGFIAGGYFNFYYNDLTDTNGIVNLDVNGNPVADSTQQVLSLEITGSVAGSVNSLGANVTSVADYGFMSALTVPEQGFAEDFFKIFSDSGSFIDTLFNQYTDGQANSPVNEIPFLTVTTLNGLNLTPIQDVLYDDTATPASAGLDTTLLSVAQKEHFDDLFGPAGVPLSTTVLNKGERTGEELSSNTQLVVVPEPTSLAIFGLGLLGLAGATRRKNS
tara:strand:+ start:3324 stop:4457 length:1134 start_codon:yes stop_codon:yes gene_type:complete